MTGIIVELAKELKDAGFSQRGENQQGHDTFFKRSDETEEKVYIPSLEELIYACGEDFSRLLYFKKYGFIAYPKIEWTGKNAVHISYKSTPTEAVANLFIKLKQNA